MKTHRFVLEKYHGPKSRTMCPHCKRYKCFTRYVDLEGKYTFPTEGEGATMRIVVVIILLQKLFLSKTQRR